MRIKTLKRNTSNVIKKTIEARQAKVSQINLNLNVLLRQKKDVERELHEREAQLVLKEGRMAESEEMQQLRAKLKVLDEGIELKTAEIAHVDGLSADVKQGGVRDLADVDLPADGRARDGRQHPARGRQAERRLVLELRRPRQLALPPRRVLRVQDQRAARDAGDERSTTATCATASRSGSRVW